MKHQQGVTLIIVMVFLVILTLLGLNTIQDTSLEEKMAANLRFKDSVFQEAEAALRQAENYLDSVTLDEFDNTNGLYDEDFDLSVFENGSSWGSSSWRPVTAFSADVEAAYVAQEIPLIGLEDSKEVGVAQDTRKIYRVTARAKGLNTSAQVVLQTTFSR